MPMSEGFRVFRNWQFEKVKAEKSAQGRVL